MTLKKTAAPDILNQSITGTQRQAFEIDQAFAQAIQYQHTGQLPEAENLLKQILEARPDHAEAWHTLGIIAHMAGRTDLAIQLIEKALEIQDQIALFHANLGEMYRLSKNLDKAIDHGRKAVDLDGFYVAAHANLGIAYYDAKNYDEARVCQERALSLNPSFPSALNNMGSILKEADELEEAETFYKRAAETAPGYLEPSNNLGAIYVKMERPEEALKVLDHVLFHMPHYPEAHCNRGHAYFLLEKEKEAIASFQHALQLRPEYPEAFAGLARLYLEKHQLEEAEHYIQKALAITPDSPENLGILGTIHMMQGHADQAKEVFEKVLDIRPAQSNAVLGMGNIALEEGDFEEAEKLFRSLLDHPKECAAALFSLTQVRKFNKDEDVYKLLLHEEKKIDDLSELKAMHMHFALGRIYDDQEDYKKAFHHYSEGCRLKRKRIDYDAELKDKEFGRIREIFNPTFIESLRGHGAHSKRPIFVVGMPRSGTTLTEQIIASHPDVYGAGELFDLLNIANWSGKRAEQNFPENMADLTPEKIQSIAEEYIHNIEKFNTPHPRTTDKMPANFVNIGLIHLAFPEAKIIHVSRDPLDTCLSCYTRLFANGQNNTYDLRELGRYYKAYIKLMDHWRSVLPQDSFYELQYEVLVGDIEAQSKRLLDYCDLKWDPVCLDFYNTKRNIRTASVAQVRKPIYSSSIDRWKNYENFLQPLIEEIGENRFL